MWDSASFIPCVRRHDRGGEVAKQTSDKATPRASARWDKIILCSQRRVAVDKPEYLPGSSLRLFSADSVAPTCSIRRSPVAVACEVHLMLAHMLIFIYTIPPPP